MPANLSLLQLEAYFLKELHYSVQDSLATIPAQVEESTTINLAITDVTALVIPEENRWRCELLVQSGDEEKTGSNVYDFKIALVGFFQIHPQLEAQEARVLAESNCPAVLFSTAREIIATITRRSPYPATLLPLVTFVKAPETEPKKEKKAPKKK